ncbi:hypothetical protein OTSGILL_0824 [Orientia tsutsugamushi str. Gilliam]|uniref:Uncharacterized protein n=1 Tax=Orientia tsutsugamushi str. Gilliam TaxID=1359184 RepID=A0A0F3MFK1_ORITS|nr:hypothetical protein OTSGILL_0824 [Orientia tsutsugamushi str. Gilliam]SPR08886.1 Uncharacterised protein [Orientia tsutsugamushi str. Gilliam]
MHRMRAQTALLERPKEIFIQFILQLVDRHILSTRYYMVDKLLYDW